MKRTRRYLSDAGQVGGIEVLPLKRTRRYHGDAGQVGGIEVLPFGFLVFVSVVLLLANVWGVVDAKLAVTTAAREAMRVFVESDPGRATDAAVRQAHDVLASYGRDSGRADISAPVLSQGFIRCGRVSITVSYEVPAISVPFFGGFGDLAPVSSTYSELIDPFRDHVGGVARC